MSSLLCPLCNAPQTAESIEAHANHCLDAANSAPAPAGAPNPAASVVSELRNSGPVVDLMVTLLCAAASGEKRNVHPDPAWPNSPASLAFRNPLTFDQRTTFTPFPFGIGFGVAGGERSIDLLLTTIDQIPAISVLQQHDSDEHLKAALDAISPLCFPLLSWIVHNQHIRLTLLPAGRHFAQMQTPWQFQAASLAQEQRFQQSRQRAQNRSFSEFYAAPITDWHSFLRSGPSVDAAKGGIGLANTGYNAYSSLGVGLIHGRAWRNSQFHGNSDMCCLALMEVADMRHAQRLVDQNLIRGNDTTPAMLATESSLVAPRYLFFYPTGAPWIAHPADARYVNPSTPVAADLHAK